MPTNLVSLLTVFPETVGQGIGPNGTSGGTVSTSAEWLAAESGGTAIQIPHLASSLSLDSIKKTPISPEEARVRFFQTQRPDYGLSNVDFGFTSYLTGRGSALADGSTATQVAVGAALLNALGGEHHTATRTAAGGGHTTTVVNVDDATTLAVGAVFAWEDADGLAHPRVITDVTGLAVTLNTALPDTPSDGDLFRGGTTYFVDEDVIGDTSTNLGSTFSACLQKGENGSAGWEVNGCKAALSSVTFGRNEYPTLEFGVTAARFTGPATGPSPTLPTATYPNPSVIGPDTQVLISNAGATALATVCNGTATIDPGVPVKASECMTARTGNMEGYGLYSTEPADTLIDINLFPHDVSWYTDQDADQNKQVAIVRNGPSGACFGVFAQNCEINEAAPGSDDFTSSVLKFRAVEVNPTTATTALERSKIRIFLG
ncbi:MAG: hypothetical protein ACRBBM_17440 [Pseudomonadaceae bacterium]